MKNLNETYLKCCDILDSLLIDYGEITSVTVNNRLYACLGKCRHYYRNGHATHKIEINPALLEDSADISELENTLIHEMLHTVPGTKGHTGLWAELAAVVKREYGYDIRRTGNTEEVEARYQARRKRNPVKYICACEKCGVEWKYKRWGKVCENPKRYTHTGCGGHLYMKWHDPKIQILGLNPKFN